jgi:aspartate carbamoyltransferase regulatory subunit
MLSVEKIENGTVIDHIKAGKGLRVLQILNIQVDYPGRVALVMNVPSGKIGKKDIVKIADKHIDEKSADKIALIAPEASLNIIKNFEVMEKRQVKLREKLVGVAACPNPNCITNHERMESAFKLDGKGIRCLYCERLFKPEELSD